MRSILPVIAACCIVPCAGAAAPAPAASDTLPATRVRDLHYGDVLFYFYQDENLEALTRLEAYDHWGRLPNHRYEARLLQGGLYLSLGLHNEAGALFEKLLTPDVPAGVRNRAWFYLAKVWYARGYDGRAEQALRQVQGRLAGALEAERQLLFAHLLMRQGRFDEAIELPGAWQGPEDWGAFARYNLGVALVRSGRLGEADPFLTGVGTLNTRRPELVNLRDRANLALGFAWLQAKEPAKARLALQRVRLDGPFSNKALLAAGWADAALGEYRAALRPWLELRDRNLLDAAVQESYLAVPYAFGKLEAHAQAAEYYETAIRSFDEETARLDASIGSIHSGRMLDRLFDGREGMRYGWFWQLKEVPDAPESRYLYALLASHEFQEGLKNYRDLVHLDRMLGRWTGDMDAFASMLEARARAHAERLPQADALLASHAVDGLQLRHSTLESRLRAVSRKGDAAALGTPVERDQWERIRRLEAALAAAGEGEELAAAREKLRLVKGVLDWQLRADFRERLWRSGSELRELDAGLREARSRWVRVERARMSVPADTGVFAARIAALGTRLTVTQARLAELRRKQGDHLEALAVRELEAQKERLASYRVQARFALASVYDRAASAEPAVAEPAVAEPAP
ncbi:MAG: hypothetical protein IPI06_04990 [Gammaproteobacteria bacterium]|nr:hypothetical protein [Gammaproteobacteria bacterium]